MVRRPTGQVRMGEQTITSVTAENRAGRRVLAVVRDAWQPTAGATGNRHGLRLGPGERTVLTTSLLPVRRGDLQAAGVTVRSFGPLGVAARQATRQLPGTVRSLPPFESRRHLPSRLARLRELDGRSAVRARGREPSVLLPDGTTVAALVAVNSMGSAVDGTTGELHGARDGFPGEFPAAPSPARSAPTRRRCPVRCHRPPPPARPPRSASSPPTPRSPRRSAGEPPGSGTTAWHARSARCTRSSTATRCSRWPPGRDPRRTYPIWCMVMEAGAACVSRAVAHALLAATGVDRRSDGGIAMPEVSRCVPVRHVSALTYISLD